MSDTPEMAADWLTQQFARVLVVEDARERGAEVLSKGMDLLTERLPVVTGALRGSQTPYAGEPPSGAPSSGPFHPLHDHSHVDAAVAKWKPGQDLGIVSALPYSGAVMLRGHSGKFPIGSLDIIAEESIR